MKRVNDKKGGLKMKRRLIEAITTIFVAIVAGILLMLMAYSIPVSLIQKHVAESIDFFENEGWGYGFAPRVSTS